MDSVYENSRIILSTVASSENSQNRGTYINERESERKVNTSKGTKALLIFFIVSLLFAVGVLCVLGTLYNSASMQLSAQEASSTTIVKELTANNSRVKEQLSFYEELKANYSRVKEQLSFYEAFTAQSFQGGENFKAFKGKLYFFSSDKLTWSSSQAFCVSRGADLVTITSQSEQKFLTSKITETCWLGLSDLKTEGRWVWVNNQTLHETGVQFWANKNPPEPDNWRYEDPSGENCASVGDEYGNIPAWFDSSCKKLKKFICEKKY